MKTLKLFNAVIAKTATDVHYPKPVVSNEFGIIIENDALWAHKEILEYCSKELLNGNDLNKTFHKSWAIIKNSDRAELLTHQIMHYMSTYGSDFKAEIYVPDEVLNIPKLKLKYKVIKAYTKDEMKGKCLDLLKSGIALKAETIDDLFSILVDELEYTFTGDEGIRNKEAIIKIADAYGIFPKDVMEFFRYIVYRATNDTLLIKSDAAIELIKNSSYNPAPAFNKFGLEKLAAIFNRFKPLFLAFKGVCPKTINKISKLSKSCHKPLVINPINEVTNTLLTDNDKKWFENATPFALFKALTACYTRVNGQDTFVYRIRNGKSWVAEAHNLRVGVAAKNFETILNFLRTKYDFSGVKVFIPKGIKYALPTSEKMFVGNIPTGTRFTGKKLAVGVYWEDSWGASDLDLSGLNIGGKVGWNSAYKQGNGSLMYSGDITSAPNGAVEYLYAGSGLLEPTLVKSNVYSGSDTCEYKIIVGKGDKMSRDYMMNPNNLIVEAKCQHVQKDTIIGMFIPFGEDKQTFVILNFGAGNARVSGNSPIVALSTKALYQQYRKPFTFNKLIKKLNAEIVDEVGEDVIDLSTGNLEKDTFTKFFDNK